MPYVGTCRKEPSQFYQFPPLKLDQITPLTSVSYPTVPTPLFAQLALRISSTGPATSEAGRMAQFLSNNSNSFNTINYYSYVSQHISVTDERLELLAWLSPLEPRIRHQDVRNNRIDDVGDWLLATDEFRGWCDCGGEDGSSNATLFCYGAPGAGKTYIR